jgi:hypothetical protein
MTIRILHKSLLVLLLSASLLIGCSTGTGEQQTSTSSSIETEAPTELPTPTPTPTPTPLPLNGQETQYFINATVNYYNLFLDVTSRSVYTNKTNAPINEMVFIVYPALYAAIYTKNVAIENRDQAVEYYWDGHRMVIPLDSPLQPDEQIEIVHEYELYMPEDGGVFGLSDGQLNLSYWFPFIPPYDEAEGWVAHERQLVNSWIVGEYLAFEAADFDVTLQFTDRRENFKIAAPALPEEENEFIHYNLDLARTFVLSISDQFNLTEREVNGTKIQSYTLYGHASTGEDVADIAVEALTLYNELYGEYDRKILTIVEFNEDIGMEFDGLIFLSPTFYNLYPGTPKSNIHVYTAHEISHQWFFSMVGNDQAMEPWLDEAFATFSERVFYERYYPDYLDWYLDNYIYAHDPYGYIDTTIYYGGDLFDYRDIVYRNGSLFLQDLRELMGDEAFFSFIQDYVRQNKYQIATTQGFISLLKSHTDADLAPLLEEYFSSSFD